MPNVILSFGALATATLPPTSTTTINPSRSTRPQFFAMDINSNRTSTHSKPRHISRLKQEMYELRLKNNPFSSPPSSTGSHDTVSTTEELTRNLSDFSFDPDAEGTRRFSSQDPKLPTSRRPTSRSGRFGDRQNTTQLNTSAIARQFPEWSGLATTTDFGGQFKTIPSIQEGKENVPPAAEQTEENFLDVLDSKRQRVRAEMQARVENESDCSTVLSRTPNNRRRSRFSSNQLDLTATSTEGPLKRSLQDVVSKIRTEKQASKNQSSPHEASPAQLHPDEALQRTPYTFRGASVSADKSGVSPTGRSFFLPAFRHLPDWTSGVLKFSAMKDGVPVFVKTGNENVRMTRAPIEHGALNSAGISEEDEQIFVSMDKLQEEVRELHDHDAMLQREAEKLQREVNQLQSELKRFQSLRKRSDSAIGSESDGSFNRRADGLNHELEDQIARLQDRLNQASRQVGVQDIHSSALTAERDEALHQASVARERAKKLQAELESAQKELESTVQSHQEKETLELENTSLLATNETLKQQHDAVAKANKKLTSQYDKLRKEFDTVQDELASARQELATLRKQYEASLEEKKLLAQDHASMERSNETYFKENKKLQAQVASLEHQIADLRKAVSSRDKLIDNIGSLTTDTAVLELNAELEAELEHLRQQLKQHDNDAQEKEGAISAKEGRIRVLREQNLELSAGNQRLLEENERLRAEYEEMRDQWIDDRHKVIRLNQLLTKNNTEYLKTLNDNTEDCVRLEDSFKQKEIEVQQKLDRRQAAIDQMKQLTSKVTELAQQEILSSRPTKITRIVEPKDTVGTKYTDGDFTGKSMNVDDDPTTELHLTQGSDFNSIMDSEIVKLRQTYRDLQNQKQKEAEAEPPVSNRNTQQLTDYDLPTLPPASANQKNKPADEASQATRIPSGSKSQPAGILKKSSQFALEEDTGRFSVKSALSIISHHSDEEEDNESVHTATVQSHRSSKSASNVQNKTPRADAHLRRNSENMTSGFFVPDITLHSEKDATTTGPAPTTSGVPSLSKDARRVLDTICKHKSGNCNVCVRIAAHGGTDLVRRSSTGSVIPSRNKALLTVEDMKKGKKTVRVEKPVPVSERVPEAYDEEPTMRPSTAPGEALAILIKETQDEIDHVQMELKKLNDVYFNLDKAMGQRERRRVMTEIKRLQAEVENKSSHLYRLHDVLEGQKQAGQLMSGEEIDVTVLSGLVRVAEATATPGRGPVAPREDNNTTRGESTRDGSEWNGFD